MGISRLPIRQDEVNFIYEHMDSILNSTGDGICIIDDCGDVQYANDLYCQMFGFTKGRIMNNYYGKVFWDQLVMKSLKHRKAMTGEVHHHDRTFQVVTRPIEKQNTFIGLKIMYAEVDNVLKVMPKRSILLENPFDNVIGSNERLVRELIVAKRASKKDVTILLRGESGTGKELIAKEIHNESGRAGGPFVAINCAAIPENLIESELFGYEAGAFTGANKLKLGQFEVASGGTIFLDEIGDLPHHLQVKLLRVLQERVIRRVGGNIEIPIDVRVIAATHQNLEEMVREKTFREDLYYRLNVIAVNLIPLRERKEDLEPLIRFFLKDLESRHGLENIEIDDEAMMAMKSYEWKGNIRELKNVLERAMIMMDEDVITFFDLPTYISKHYEIYDVSKPTSALVNLKKDGNLATLEEYEKEIIQLAVDRFGSFNSAGKALGITHKTVAAKYRKFNDA